MSHDLNEFSHILYEAKMKARASSTYKTETGECEDEAFPVIVGRIREFLDALDEGVSAKYEAKWSQPDMQGVARKVRELCKLHEGGGCVLSGSCQVHRVDAMGASGVGVLARFYSLSGGRLVPVFD